MTKICRKACRVPGASAVAVGGLALIGLAGCSAAVRQDPALPWTYFATFDALDTLSVERVELEVEPGVFLRGAYAMPAEQEGPIVLFLGESGPREVDAPDGQSKWITFPPVFDLLGDGFSVLALDYRGRGESDGRFSLDHIPADARVMWTEAVRRAGGPEQVIVRAAATGTLALDELVRSGAGPAAFVVLTPEHGIEFNRPEGVRWLRRGDVDPDELASGEMEFYARVFPAMDFAFRYSGYCALREPLVPIHPVPNFEGREVNVLIDALESALDDKR